jgi:hypothetical protein
MSDTPRIDEADKFITYSSKLDGKAYATEWVYASFAQDLEIELNEAKHILDQQARQIISLNSTIEQLRKELEELE